MKMNHQWMPLAMSAVLLSCENPADQTTDATVTEASAEENQANDHHSHEAPAWTLKEGSTLKFVGSKVTGSHEGGFNQVDAHLHVDDDEGVMGGSVVIDMKSIWSDNDKLTEHLKSDDFFAVEKHSTSTFSLTRIKHKGGSDYELSGDLDMHGVTKNITFPATGTREGNEIKVDSEFDINRKDWGIVYEGKKDDLIRDEVVLKMDLTFIPDEEGHHH